MTTIPLFNCELPASALRAIKKPFRSGQLATGCSVTELEQSISKRFEQRHAVAVSDMTHALVLALRLSGVGPGNEVMTLSFNCLSSNSAILMAGAKAVWIDVDPNTASFDVEHARRNLTTRTKAVIVYHVSGYPAPLDSIRKFCDEYNLVLIEDANCAFGASVENNMVGMIGDFSIFSFYANRQINAIEGGILLCKKEEVAEHAKKLRRFGIDFAKFRDQDGEIDPSADIPEIGTSATLNNINATLALSSIADVDLRIEQSRSNAVALTEATQHLDITAITAVFAGNPVYWTWLIRLSKRDAIMRALKARGTMCSKLHYANHHYSGFASPSCDLPGTKILEEQLLAIPCGWWIDKKAILKITTDLQYALKNIADG